MILVLGIPLRSPASGAVGRGYAYRCSCILSDEVTARSTSFRSRRIDDPRRDARLVHPPVGLVRPAQGPIGPDQLQPRAIERSAVVLVQPEDVLDGATVLHIEHDRVHGIARLRSEVGGTGRRGRERCPLVQVQLGSRVHEDDHAGRLQSSAQLAQQSNTMVLPRDVVEGEHRERQIVGTALERAQIPIFDQDVRPVWIEAPGPRDHLGGDVDTYGVKSELSKKSRRPSRAAAKVDCGLPVHMMSEDRREIAIRQIVRPWKFEARVRFGSLTVGVDVRECHAFLTCHIYRMAQDIRILLLADSHLGFDLPVRARVGRRRRGHDFLANYAAALRPALDGEVDAVVHAGDVFDRSRVVSTLAYQAFEPLRRIADRGVPVFVVPGNHERSVLPHTRFASHPLVHVFDRPRTFSITMRGTTVALAGFPYERHDVRQRFAELLRRTEWDRVDATHRLLCIHQCVEGATVGPGNYTFTSASDVIRGRDVPAGVGAVLSGHIHRHQVLTTDPSGRPLNAPVLYPGSIERTSVAEIGETKGYLIVQMEPSGDSAVRWAFRELPARPMRRHEIAAHSLSARRLASEIESIVAAAPRDAVLSILVAGELTEEHWRAVSATQLRALVPPTMNVEIVPTARFVGRSSPRVRTESSSPQLSFI